MPASGPTSSSRPARSASRDWTVAPAPPDLDDRRVEITGPAEPKMMINALNSGARVFMADLEDSLSPTWANVVGGQAALDRRGPAHARPSIRPRARPTGSPTTTATLVVRPRGWHLVESARAGRRRPGLGQSCSTSGCTCSTTAPSALRRGTGPYFYLAKLESHHEARLWNDVFVHGAGRARHPARLDPGDRPDRDDPRRVRDGRDPVRAARARRGPQRRPLGLPVLRHQDVPASARARRARPRPADDDGAVHARLHRAAGPDVPPARRARDRRDGGVHPEPARPGGDRRGAWPRSATTRSARAGDGFDGTWVAHPDLVPLATEIFDGVLGDRAEPEGSARATRCRSAPARAARPARGGRRVTEAGVRANVRVALAYIDSWLRGIGAAAIDNLMEDAATAEISRSQLWQWRTRGSSWTMAARSTAALRGDPRRGAGALGGAGGGPAGRGGRAPRSAGSRRRLPAGLPRAPPSRASSSSRIVS